MKIFIKKNIKKDYNLSQFLNFILILMIVLRNKILQFKDVNLLIFDIKIYYKFIIYSLIENMILCVKLDDECK